MEVLEELGAGEKPMIVVLNKIDLINNTIGNNSIELNHPDALYISTKTKEGLDDISERIEELLNRDKHVMTLLIPPDRYDLISMIQR